MATHHYSGGPKTEDPHHMGPKDTVGSSKKTTSGGHYYTGGPSTWNPHPMGEQGQVNLSDEAVPAHQCCCSRLPETTRRGRPRSWTTRRS